jgi:YhcH/YjgK/YiaL family protein
MIIDTIENLKLYKSLSHNMTIAINYLITSDLNNLKIGKHEIAKDDIFVLMSEYNTKDEIDCKTETHKKYIDIQIMLKGEEKFGFYWEITFVPPGQHNQIHPGAGPRCSYNYN